MAEQNRAPPDGGIEHGSARMRRISADEGLSGIVRTCRIARSAGFRLQVGARHAVPPTAPPRRGARSARSACFRLQVGARHAVPPTAPQRRRLAVSREAPVSGCRSGHGMPCPNGAASPWRARRTKRRFPVAGRGTVCRASNGAPTAPPRRGARGARSAGFRLQVGAWHAVPPAAPQRRPKPSRLRVSRSDLR
jgi:hypothetical protein